MEGLESDLTAGLAGPDSDRLLQTIELFGALEYVRSTKPLLDMLGITLPAFTIAV